MSMADLRRALLSQRRRGYSLPQGLDLDPAAHELDRRAPFERHRIQAGLTAEIARPGDYITLNVGGSSIPVLRQLDRP